MISVVTRVDTKGAHKEILKREAVETADVFMDNIYNDIKEAYKEEAVTIKQVKELSELLTELVSRTEEEKSGE